MIKMAMAIWENRLEIRAVENGIEDLIVWSWAGDETEHRSEVRIGPDGGYYFMAGDCFVSLDECEREGC